MRGGWQESTVIHERPPEVQTLLAWYLTAATDPAVPTTDEDRFRDIGPGFAGFVATGLMVVVVIFLIVDMMRRIRRILPFASMSSQLIRFRLDAGGLELSSEDLDFATSAKERLVCTYNGQPLQIGFRGDFLNEILNSINTDEIKILLGDPSRAGIIVPTIQPENEDVLMLIMPLLLND